MKLKCSKLEKTILSIALIGIIIMALTGIVIVINLLITNQTNNMLMTICTYIMAAVGLIEMLFMLYAVIDAFTDVFA